jgi:hypothetical protein
VRPLLLIVLVAAAGAACSRASEESEAKRSPVPPPPPEVEIPRDLEIDVTLDGTAAEPITRARLEAIEPDFADEERRAWRLTTVLPALDTPGAVIEARGPTGVSVRIERPADAAMPAPVLFFTRRGDVVVSVVDPANPFPGYHGQGGQLKRQGDPLPRLSPVTALAIVTKPE